MVGRCGWIAAVLALSAACPSDIALAGAKRDFVSGPWRGYAMFDDGEGRFRGCSAAIEGRDDPALVWTHWYDREHLEIKVQNPPWTVRGGEDFRVTLSVDDAWRTDAPARVLAALDASRPVFLSILGADVEALPEAAAGGRTLTVERAGERPLSFSLSGADRMLEGLERCHRRGIALQRKAGGGAVKASDFFVPQEDAEAFARWAEKLSRYTHAAVTLVGMGDGVCRSVERLSSGPVDPRLVKFLLGIAVSPAAEATEKAQRAFADLDAFEPASGNRDLSVVLRAMAEGLLEKAEDTLRDSQHLIPAMSRGDSKETRRLYAAIARRSYLSYAGDNLYLLVRNAARSDRNLEYHLNQASRSINLMNVALVNAILFLPDDALAAKMPALIASSRGHIRDARGWARSGRAILTARLADAMRLEESRASRDRIALLGLYAESLDEEETLADRFAAALTEVETPAQSGTAPARGEFMGLVHGGERSAAALLQSRFALRLKRGAAHEGLEGR